MERFPSTIRNTLGQLREALASGRHNDVICLLYQMRGAASWVCADSLFERIVVMLRAVESGSALGASGDGRAEALLQQLSEQVQRTCEAISGGASDLNGLGAGNATALTLMASVPDTTPISPEPQVVQASEQRASAPVLAMDIKWGGESNLFHSMSKVSALICTAAPTTVQRAQHEK